MTQEHDRHALDCAIYLSALLTWSNHGRIAVAMPGKRVWRELGIPEARQVAVRNTLRRAGLVRLKSSDDGFLVEIGAESGKLNHE